MSQAQNVALALQPTDHEGHGRRLASTLGRGLPRTPENRQAEFGEKIVSG